MWGLLVLGIPAVAADAAQAATPAGWTAEASSTRSGFPASNAIDGALSTFWLSESHNPGEGPTVANPTTFTITRDEPLLVDDVTVAPLATGSGPKTFDIHALVDGSWETLASVANAPKLGAKDYAIPATITTGVRLIITDG